MRRCRHADSYAMRAIRKTPARLPLAAALALSGLVLLGCSIERSDPVARSSDSAGLGPANIPLPPGEWAATGVVLRQDAWSNQPVGAVLKRPWTFRKSCQSSCRTLFLR